ncbi:ADP-ribosylglycohydrolase [Priestia flexa]|nr:ADP-ribosylglycohydrolase [Priestia flexa]
MGSKEDNKQLLKRKLYPAMLGGIVGDGLGVPVEFKNRALFKVTEMTGYGTYNQPPGTWSDDTSLTMCLVENILENEDDVGLMHKFAHYRDNDTGPHTAKCLISALQQMKQFIAISKDYHLKNGEEVLSTTMETERSCELRLYFLRSFKKKV